MRRSVPRRALVLGLALVIVVLARSPVAPAIADPECTGLVAPVAGPVLRSFAPIGSYAGHWGVDLGASPGSPVGSAGTGVVSFAGTVVDLLTVTVDHGGGLRTSYSYLGSVAVGVGAPVSPHTVIGTSGVDNGIEAVHFSVRVGADYLDPEPWLRCLPPASGPLLDHRRPGDRRLCAGARGHRSLCWPRCDAASSAARSTLPTSLISSPPRPPTGNSPSTWSP